MYQITPQNVKSSMSRMRSSIKWHIEEEIRALSILTTEGLSIAKEKAWDYYGNHHHIPIVEKLGIEEKFQIMPYYNLRTAQVIRIDKKKEFYSTTSWKKEYDHPEFSLVSFNFAPEVVFFFEEDKK